MSSLIKAADECRKLLRGFQAFEEVANALEQVGSLERAGNELQAKVAQLGDQVKQATGEIAAAKEEAERVVSEAKEEATKLKKAATERAEEILAKAEKDAVAAIERAGKKSEGLEEAAAALRAEVNNLQSSRDGLANDVAELEKKLAKLRSQAAAIAG